MNCVHCSQSFTSELRLRQHELANSCKTCCPLCKKPFSTKQKLNQHLKKRTCTTVAAEKENPNNTCAVCQRDFSSKQRLQSHLKRNKCQGPVKAEDKKPEIKYQFDDLECYDCGDLMFRCPCPYVEILNKEKKRIDDRFGVDPAFDDMEGVSWGNRPHWTSIHHGGCNEARDSERHIWCCLSPFRDRWQPIKEPEEEIFFLDNSCYGCKKVFSTRQMLQYHMKNNVCGALTQTYDPSAEARYDAMAKKIDDDFDEANKERIKELSYFIRQQYGNIC